MKRLKRILSNKIFYVFFIFVIVLFPSALYLDAEVASKAIVPIVGIDKTETGIELSVLVLAPDKSSQGGNVELESTEGKDVSEAIGKLNLEIGKVIGLDHCEAIIFGEEAMKENIVFYLDYLMRTNNMSNNSEIVNCEGTAKEFLKTMGKNNHDLIFSLRNMVSFNLEYTFTGDSDVETFYQNYFSKSPSSFVPVMSLEEEESDAGSGGSSSGGSSGSQSSSESSDSGGSSSSSKSMKQIKSEGRAAIVKNGIKVREATEDERAGYNLLTKTIKRGTIHLDDVNDENFENGKLDFEISKKGVSRKVKFDGDTPYYEVKIKLILKLDAVECDNYTPQTLDSTKQYITPEVEEKLKEEMNEKIDKVFEEMKINKIDTLDIARDFDRFHNKKWKAYLAGLEDKEAYLDGIDFRVTFDIKGKV